MAQMSSKFTRGNGDAVDCDDGVDGIKDDDVDCDGGGGGGVWGVVVITLNHQDLHYDCNYWQ